MAIKRNLAFLLAGTLVWSQLFIATGHAVVPVTKLDKRIAHIEFERGNINQVLRLLQKETGISIITGRGVSGEVSGVSLHGVTLRQALDQILPAYGFDWTINDDVITIIPSTDSSMRIDKRYKFYNAGFRPSQVKIEARIVEKTHDKTMGFSNTMEFIGYSSLARVGSLFNQVQISGQQLATSEDDSGINTVNVPAGVEEATTFFPEALTVGIGLFGVDNIIQRLSLSGTDSTVEVIARPNIVTVDGETATIEVTREYPIETPGATVDTPPTVEWKDIGLKLKVTPIINADFTIRMDLSLEHGNPAGVGVRNYPIFQTRKIESKIYVDNGETLVIGGLLNEEKTISVSKVPFLGDLPYIGNIFSSRSTRDTTIEMFVLLKPEIIDNIPPVSKRHGTDGIDRLTAVFSGGGVLLGWKDDVPKDNVGVKSMNIYTDTAEIKSLTRESMSGKSIKIKPTSTVKYEGKYTLDRSPKRGVKVYTYMVKGLDKAGKQTGIARRVAWTVFKDGRTVKLDWSGDSIAKSSASYAVYRDGKELGKVTKGKTYKDSSKKEKSSLYFAVTAVDVSGNEQVISNSEKVDLFQVKIKTK